MVGVAFTPEEMKVLIELVKKYGNPAKKTSLKYIASVLGSVQEAHNFMAKLRLVPLSDEEYHRLYPQRGPRIDPETSKKQLSDPNTSLGKQWADLENATLEQQKEYLARLRAEECLVAIVIYDGDGKEIFIGPYRSIDEANTSAIQELKLDQRWQLVQIISPDQE